MSEILSSPRRSPRVSSGRLARVVSVLCAGACLAAPGTARADYFDDVWNGRPQSFCGVVFGTGCRYTMSADIVLAYQPTVSDDNGREDYSRPGLELAMAHRIAEDVHLGPTVEFGVQDGRFMTGFHIVPKARLRYWISGSPVSLDVSLGGYYGRAWFDTGEAGRNRAGFQMDAGLGLAGSIHFVGGFAVLADPAGLYGVQSQGFVGARVSFLTAGAAVLYVLAAVFRH